MKRTCAQLPSLGVIIPTLNEAASISRTIRSIKAQTSAPQKIVVVDGGSTDGTLQVAKDEAVEVVRSPVKGRGNQIALGLEHLSQDVALIVHADMNLHPASVAKIVGAMHSLPDCPGGCLGHRFDKQSLAIRYIQAWDWWRARVGGVSFGDQAQFFRPSLLESVGGFPAQPLMEDLELSQRLKKVGLPIYVGLPATVSCRRFETMGVWRATRLNADLRKIYREEGLAACQKLYERYVGEKAK